MSTLSHNTDLQNGIRELELLSVEEEAEIDSLPFEMAWCGGSKNRGCGNKLNLFTVRYEDGFAVCPHCGRRN